MISRIQLPILHLLVISFVLAASLTFFGTLAMAQKPESTPTPSQTKDAEKAANEEKAAAQQDEEEIEKLLASDKTPGETCEAVKQVILELTNKLAELSSSVGKMDKDLARIDAHIKEYSGFLDKFANVLLGHLDSLQKSRASIIVSRSRVKTRIRNIQETELPRLLDLLAKVCPPKKPKQVSYVPKVELGLGYAYMNAPDEPAKNLNGFNASLFYNVKPWIAIGGEFSGEFGSTTANVGAIRFDTSLQRYTYLFGPQFNFYPNDKVKIFVHPLFGGVHDTGKTTFGTSSVSSSASAFAMAFGGGIDVRVNKSVAVRAFEADYIPTHFGGQWQSNYRISTGIVFRFGKR